MRIVLGSALVVVIGIGVFGVVMQPTMADRLAMGLIFTLMVAIAIVGARWLPRAATANRSLKTTVVSLSLVSFFVVVLGLLAAGQQMFISRHDLTLMLIVIAFGVMAAVIFAIMVSGPITTELSQIAATASSIAAGHLTMRTSVTRADEVGDLAMAINEMAHALDEAERTRVRAEEARRDFFTAVGHDLRTPLASLQAALEAVEDGMTDEPGRYIASMRSDVGALSRLVDDLFLLARLDSGDLVNELESVDLSEVADEAVEVLRPLCNERDLTVRLEMQEHVMAMATPDGLSRVVRNLLDNAVRHSPIGGEIVVDVSNGHHARVVITDQGEGFAEGFLEQAFERFSRQTNDRSRSDGGAGLGLAIARRLIDEFGGEIWADPGPGGKVAFMLPNGDMDPDSE